MTRYLSIKNFDKYQHYKDRRPPWIKLHASLLDDYDFIQLPDTSKAHLMLMWVLASQMDNKIPYDLAWISQRIGARSPVDIEELILRGFVEPYQEGARVGKLENWASRYVSAQTRAALLSAAQHKCAACGSAEKLEIDHIVPISQGGTGDVSNLQVLCRQCNRRKRARLQHEQQDKAAHLRSKPLHSGSGSTLLETETETEGETETTPPLKKRAVRVLPRPSTGPAFALAPYLDAHEERFPGGHISPGHLGKVMKVLEAKHGPAEVLARWKLFLAEKGTLGPDYFARTWSEWAPRVAGVPAAELPRVLRATEQIIA